MPQMNESTMRQITIAGKTICVSAEVYDRLKSPDGWSELSLEELRSVGILPDQAMEGFDPPVLKFRRES